MKTLLLVTFLAFGSSVFAQDFVTKSIDQGIDDLTEIINAAEIKNSRKKNFKNSVKTSQVVTEKKYSALKRIVKFVPVKEEEIITLASKE